MSEITITLNIPDGRLCQDFLTDEECPLLDTDNEYWMFSCRYNHRELHSNGDGIVKDGSCPSAGVVLSG